MTKVRILPLMATAAQLAVLLAGCTASPTAEEPGQPTLTTMQPPSVVQGRREPTGLEAPAFHATAIELLRNARNPSLAVDESGELLLTGPGCIQDLPCETSTRRNDTYVLQSKDGGVSWLALNDASGALAQRPGPALSMAASVAVDPLGRRYVLDVVQAYDHYPPGPVSIASSESGPRYARLFTADRSDQAWRYVTDVRPPAGLWSHAWLAAGSSNDLVAVWQGGRAAAQMSRDAGMSWSTLSVPEAELLGPPLLAHGGGILIPAWAPSEHAAPNGLRARQPIVIASHDHGATWTTNGPTHAAFGTTSSGEARQGFPVLVQTGDGGFVLAWSQLDYDDTLATGSSIRFATSADGVHWSAPTRAATAPNALRPWLVAGAGDRFALAYYATQQTGDPNHAYGASWDVAVTVVAGPRETVESVVEAEVHVGSICTTDDCLVSNPDVPGEFLAAGALTDGRLVVIYGIDSDGPEAALGDVGAAGLGTLRVAQQVSGTPLFLT